MQASVQDLLQYVHRKYATYDVVANCRALEKRMWVLSQRQGEGHHKRKLAGQLAPIHCFGIGLMFCPQDIMSTDGSKKDITGGSRLTEHRQANLSSLS